MLTAKLTREIEALLTAHAALVREQLLSELIAAAGKPMDARRPQSDMATATNQAPHVNLEENLEERDRAVCTLYRSGKSRSQVSRALGLRPAVVDAALRRHHIPPHTQRGKGKPSRDLAARNRRIIELAAAGHTNREISRMTGAPSGAVSGLLHRHRKAQANGGAS